VLDLLRSSAAPLALALVAMVIVFKLIRPALTAMLAPPPPPPPGSQLDEIVENEIQPPAPPPPPLLQPPGENPRLEAARAMARQNPAAVANIVRGWVNGEVA
jgi:flagellar M-ring protein FliF